MGGEKQQTRLSWRMRGQGMRWARSSCSDASWKVAGRGDRDSDDARRAWKRVPGVPNIGMLRRSGESGGDLRSEKRGGRALRVRVLRSRDVGVEGGCETRCRGRSRARARRLSVHVARWRSNWLVIYVGDGEWRVGRGEYPSTQAVRTPQVRASRIPWVRRGEVGFTEGPMWGGTRGTEERRSAGRRGLGAVRCDECSRAPRITRSV
jgi:hypothetical protein